MDLNYFKVYKNLDYAGGIFQCAFGYNNFHYESLSSCFDGRLSRLLQRRVGGIEQNDSGEKGKKDETSFRDSLKRFLIGEQPGMS